MPVTRELSFTYAGVTIGGSSARQITEYTIEGDSYETGYFECEFVTTSASAAALASELNTLRTAFRTPRGDLVVTQGGSTILSRKQSDNTGFDANPEILKDGDPADTGRSRHLRVRIEYGRPADDVVNTAFRRWSTVNVQYDPSRRRTVTINGVYTANSTDGTTGSFAQYRAQINAYSLTVLDEIDDDASWELVGEPSVERGETDKITNFSAVYKEIIYKQSKAATDDSDIIDPVMTVNVERISPGDSIAGAAKVKGGFSFQLTGSGTNTGTLEQENDPVTPGGSVARPITITINYECSVNKERTTNLSAKWASTVRPLMVAAATEMSGGGKFVITLEKPGFDPYNNRITATMVILAYSSSIIKQKITVTDSTHYGKTLVGVWTVDPFDYYEYPGPCVRVRTYSEEREQIVGTADPAKVIDPMIAGPGASLSGVQDPANWTLISRTPASAVIRQGLDGGSRVNIAEMKVETVAQFRKLKKPSIANAGGITGGVAT